MAFADDLAKLPLTATKTDAEGFLPPILRAFGHLLFVLVQTADEGSNFNDEEAKAELAHAKEHWNVVNHNDALSAPTAQTITHFANALDSAIDEWDDWNTDTRLRNVRDLANRTVGIGVALDRELVGLRGSDAGYRL